MNFIKRLKFFLLGITIGLITIIGIFGKRTFFYSYFPNQRILNNLSKKRIFIKKNYNILLSNKLKYYINYSFFKKELLIKGKINFKKSFPRKKPFPKYQIQYKNDNKIYIFNIENQSKKFIVENIYILSKKNKIYKLL